MAERPIIFSGPMVRAIIEGRKTQARRVVKDANGAFWDHAAYRPAVIGGKVDHWLCSNGTKTTECAPRPVCPYGAPGDRLWVREKWRPAQVSGAAWYAEVCGDSEHDRWRSPIHMPRWASRLTLEVVSVRVERLQEISDKDAKAEGISPVGKWHGTYSGLSYESRGFDADDDRHRSPFAALWDSINAKRHPWASNPWVWVVEFRRSEEARRG